MSTKSPVTEMHQVQLAMELIELGARLQVLETETNLSRTCLTKLYKELRGKSPPKGMLPFSTDWFITWLPNIHASLFINIHQRLQQDFGCDRIDAFVRAFRLYQEQVQLSGQEPVLALTRAWTLMRFFENDLLQLTGCTRCGGQFIVHAYAPIQDYRCGLCHPPSRAGKTMRRAAAVAERKAS
ncbi:MAG: flagellar transcriptional regulator FlhC [Lamprobacter sp.]|uniref:flagellar transcriptional regulator FlhC n=1 Tax=Lamprobacter sp. TaxID=3100796 RepID=UPI002B257C7B|nr:flagellar transcriptional regulator FlhC [Lamprobacter sp.]MEA3639771.1 flagellar transcriptional regulator FlhC [Lamprobacter sp.]